MSNQRRRLRDLCEAVKKEPDSEKLIRLVEELIETLDNGETEAREHVQVAALPLRQSLHANHSRLVDRQRIALIDGLG
jgi:hypothetical protein